MTALPSLPELRRTRAPIAWLFALVAVLALACVVPAHAAGLTFPALTGRVVDQAGVIPADLEATLTTRLEQLERQSGDQLVVATLTSLQGTDIADYGYQLGRSWGIGQAKLNNGVLLIIAPAERKVRIEVGYGLEGTLTDALTSVVIQKVILPRFKAGDMPAGIREGAEAIADILQKQPDKLEQRTLEAAPSNTISPETMLFVFAFGIFLLVVIASGFFGQPVVPTAGGSRRRGSSSTSDTSSSSSWSTGSWSSGSSSSSSSDSGFSGGGGSFGGGGSSGSW